MSVDRPRVFFAYGQVLLYYFLFLFLFFSFPFRAAQKFRRRERNARNVFCVNDLPRRYDIRGSSWISDPKAEPIYRYTDMQIVSTIQLILEDLANSWIERARGLRRNPPVAAGSEIDLGPNTGAAFPSTGITVRTHAFRQFTPFAVFVSCRSCFPASE